MTDLTISDLDDLPVVEDHPETPEERRQRIARRKALPIVKANRSPNFNVYPRTMTKARKEWLERERAVVRQPEVLPMFQKPLKPVGLR